MTRIAIAPREIESFEEKAQRLQILVDIFDRMSSPSEQGIKGSESNQKAEANGS